MNRHDFNPVSGKEVFRLQKVKRLYQMDYISIPFPGRRFSDVRIEFYTEGNYISIPFPGRRFSDSTILNA